MKNVFSLLLVFMVSITLVGCAKSTTVDVIDFAEYDFTNLTTCMEALLDDDSETTCTNEDADAYIIDYANYFIQYLDPQVEADGILRGFEETMYVGDLHVSIGFSNVPNSMGENSLSVFNQILVEVTQQLKSIVLTDLDMIKIIKPEVRFDGEPVVGLFENYDIPAFQYLARNGTSEIFQVDLRYYEDVSLTEDFDTFLERLDILSNMSVGNSFRLYRSNGREIVSVNIRPSDSEFYIHVAGEGQLETDLIADDFLSYVETQYPDYIRQTEWGS